MESLSQYVRRVMDEKHLTMKEIERRCGNAIGDSHISNVLHGAATNLTIDKLVALATGLGVAPLEIVRVAMGLEPDDINIELVARVLGKLADPALSRLLIVVDQMNEKQVKSLITAAEKIVSK